MKFVIVLTAVLALATAATLPSQKLDSQNELFESNENNNYSNDNDEYIPEREERDSIANSFDAIVNVLRQYKNDVTKPDDSRFNEITVPDTVNIGFTADTFLTDVHVKGLNNLKSQNITMNGGEDLIHVINCWEELEVNGVFHHTNAVASHSGIFHLDIIEPKYMGETVLTKNSNVYPLMPTVGSVKFEKLVANHTSLPEVFQNEKPQFDYLVKYTIPQSIATARVNDMYNDVTLEIRRAVKHYMVYNSNKIASQTALPIAGNLADGFRFELKNLDFDNSKNNLAKIAFVQVIKTKESCVARLELRLLGMIGEFDSVVTSPDGKSNNRRATYTTDAVKVVCNLDFVKNSVRTKVHVTRPQVQLTSIDSDSSVNWSDVQKQLVPHFDAYFVRTLENAINHNVQHSMM